MARPVSMKIGDKFGMLTVNERAPNIVKGQSRWVCRCDCGNDSHVVYATHLRAGSARSCGCNRLASMSATKRERAAERTHCMSKTPTYYTWNMMRQRCTNPKAPDYDKYGGRGIKVCERWANSFEDFLSDMGIRPEAKTLDRRDNDGNYDPDNCRWATLTEQQANRSRTAMLTYNGETLPLAEWSRRAGIRNKNVYMRLKCGWTPAQALGFEPRS